MMKKNEEEEEEKRWSFRQSSGRRIRRHVEVSVAHSVCFIVDII
jgi:hypothetical protein